jgi:hypothetical protein
MDRREPHEISERPPISRMARGAQRGCLGPRPLGGRCEHVKPGTDQESRWVSRPRSRPNAAQATVVRIPRSSKRVEASNATPTHGPTSGADSAASGSISGPAATASRPWGATKPASASTSKTPSASISEPRCTWPTDVSAVRRASPLSPASNPPPSSPESRSPGSSVLAERRLRHPTCRSRSDISCVSRRYLL